MNFITFELRQAINNKRGQGLQIHEPVGFRGQNENCDLELREILLKVQISVDSNKDFKGLLRYGKQVTILLARPTHLRHG